MTDPTPAPRPRPVYRHPPAKVGEHRIRRVEIAVLAENLYFGLSTVIAIVFAVIVLRQGDVGLLGLVHLVGFWAVLAYLALPRLHRVLTSIYVPDYFIGRARTSDGLLGDPLNLAFTGPAAQLHTAMRRAGWVLADPVNLASSVRIVTASLTRRTYAHAPVSPLFVFGRMQAFAYQQEVDGNPSQRHHVRFWPCPPGWLLPGGHRVDWLAAGTYDRAVGLSLFTLQVTHKVDRDIDIERDYLIQTLQYADPGVTTRVIEDFSTGYHDRNGGGDAVQTDGNLPVVDVSEVRPDPTLVPAEPASAADLPHRVGRRPFSIFFAGVMIALSLVSELMVGLANVPGLVGRQSPEAGTGPAGGAAALAGVAAVLGIAAILGILAWFTYQGRRGARLTMLGLLTISLLTQLLQYLGGDRLALVAMLSMSADVLVIYALTSGSARSWTDRQEAARQVTRHG